MPSVLPAPPFEAPFPPPPEAVSFPFLEGAGVFISDRVVGRWLSSCLLRIGPNEEEDEEANVEVSG